MTAQQANGAEIKTLTRRGQCMQMIGVGTAQTDDAFGTGPVSGFQVLDEFEPLVTTDQRIDPIQTQHRHFNAGTGKPIQMKGFEVGLRMPVEGGE